MSKSSVLPTKQAKIAIYGYPGASLALNTNSPEKFPKQYPTNSIAPGREFFMNPPVLLAARDNTIGNMGAYARTARIPSVETMAAFCRA
ncbi:hypothetical protein EYZ11_009524 [Aspergillus tanneri]|uniref:Uncharacterized protein n=1 Tax=Aspergillus tanneri TaxID=1220188 RepID=A0A4S3J7Q1_9EURO|nr:hypothetical protein EYZ11_009524 [Aspergillus tanneri]